MPFIKYKDIKIRAEGMALIDKVNQIVEEYYIDGYSLTLRQIYYQLVARGILPNNERSYKNLGSLISDGRLAGFIDWLAVEDRTRYVRRLVHWDSPAEMIEIASDNYHIDLWETQPHYIEVWVEKDALIGIVEQVVNRYDVSCFSCRGYTSQSEMWSAARRLKTASYNGDRPVTIIHLGDHDPSGIDMTRDILERLTLFCEDKVELAVERIALNKDQIKKYNPPPNPAKITDPRAGEYIASFGDVSWELDAIEPKQLDRLISTTIEQYIDENEMDVAEAKQRRERKALNDAKNFVTHRHLWQRKQRDKRGSKNESS